MSRDSRAFLLAAVSGAFLSGAALAQDGTDGTDAPAADGTATISSPAQVAEKSMAKTEPESEAISKPDESTDKTAKFTGKSDEWQTEVNGYFRVPMALGISSRPNADEIGRQDENGNPIPPGASHTQISYATNRVMDWNYYSFAYTRLQEQDWGEITFHKKKKHVDAAIGWMGYWFAAAGFRNPDAAAVPGIATLALDTDINLGAITSNLTLKMGAWWPQFGYFQKYDTFTLGRFRHVGEQLKWSIPISSDITLMVFQGFGTGRDGSFKYMDAAVPLYAAKVGTVLIAYGHLELTIKDMLRVGAHYNTSWTRDPYLTDSATYGRNIGFSNAREAFMTTIGGEVSLNAAMAGRLWVSPSFINVKNGWALGSAGGTEVLHSLGGVGIATNYLGWISDTRHSTGTGKMLNVGFLYENSLNTLLGKDPGVGDLTLNIFGLYTSTSLELPADSLVTWKKNSFMKYGADLTYQAQDWLSLMVRGDTVSYSLENPGYLFSSITGRVTIFSRLLSSEHIYLQFSRYVYGDKMLLAGNWPWNFPMVDGSNIVQAGKYARTKPDENVIKLQASVSF